MLKVDDEMVEVPETHAWNPVLMEDRFDLTRIMGQSGFTQLYSKDCQWCQDFARDTISEP